MTNTTSDHPDRGEPDAAAEALRATPAYRARKEVARLHGLAVTAVNYGVGMPLSVWSGAGAYATSLTESARVQNGHHALAELDTALNDLRQVRDLLAATLAEQAEQVEPKQAELDTRRTDLLRRAALVRVEGWGHYLYTWSGEDVAAVAYLLSDLDTLAEQGTSPTTVLADLAATLWGSAGADTDRAADYPRTRAWLEDLRAELDA
ncbi:hypothetical protein ACWDOP_00690 [Nocardia sp. NPDC003693]